MKKIRKKEGIRNYLKTTLGCTITAMTIGCGAPLIEGFTPVAIQ